LAGGRDDYGALSAFLKIGEVFGRIREFLCVRRSFF
jgi:hypothetical protein